MDEYREHVVLTANDRHVVLELGRIHFTASSGQHADDVILQSFIIHLDIVGHGVKGTC